MYVSVSFSQNLQNRYRFCIFLSVLRTSTPSVFTIVSIYIGGLSLMNDPRYSCFLLSQRMLSSFQKAVLVDHMTGAGKRCALALAVVAAGMVPLHFVVRRLAVAHRRKISQMAASGAIPPMTAKRIQDAEYQTDEEFQSVCVEEVKMLGFQLFGEITRAAITDQLVGGAVVGICCLLDAKFPQLVAHLPAVGDGPSALTFVIFVSNVGTSTVCRWLRLPKWVFPCGPISCTAALDEPAIGQFCCACSPIHMVLWKLVPSIYSGPGSVVGAGLAGLLGLAGSKLNLSIPFTSRGGTFNGAFVALMLF